MLRSLHPACSTDLPSLPHNAPHIIIDASAHIISTVKRMMNGAAPGPSGWTADMVYILTQDIDCLNGLTHIIRDITNGTLPDSVKPYLLASTLVGVDKANGSGV